jgi:glycosyltransferase involved in cell wall biosynthesis
MPGSTSPDNGEPVGSRPPALVSLVIPAYNEAAVVGRTLDAVFAQDHPGPLEVIVVANGCEDDTALVANRFASVAAGRGATLSVLELSDRGKPGALNAGDAVATGAVRVYLDADVTISPSTISALVAALEHDGTELAAPDMRVVLPSSHIVRGYLTVWARLPYVMEGGAALTVYALSQMGRARWDRYPDILADDTYARLHFEASEVTIVKGATVAVRFPEKVREMVAVRARLFLGIWELRERCPLLMSDDAPRGRIALETIRRSPDLWLRAPAFFAIYILGWLHARRSVRRGEHKWARAESSRTTS